MRLGDLDKLKSEFDIIANNSATNEWQTLPINHIKQIIDNTPTIIWCNETPEGLPLMDMRVKPHGEWIRTGLYGQTCLECNNCGKADFDIKYYNFCPNCGASMKGGYSWKYKEEIS